MLDRALANEEHRGNGGKACGDAYHHAAGKIKHAPLGHHAVRRPDHVDEGVVDVICHRMRIRHQALNDMRLINAPVISGGVMAGKHHLVGHAPVADSQHRVVVVQRVQGDVAQEGVMERVTDDAQAAPMLGQRTWNSPQRTT